MFVGSLGISLLPRCRNEPDHVVGRESNAAPDPHTVKAGSRAASARDSSAPRAASANNPARSITRGAREAGFLTGERNPRPPASEPYASRTSVHLHPPPLRGWTHGRMDASNSWTLDVSM